MSKPAFTPVQAYAPRPSLNLAAASFLLGLAGVVLSVLVVGGLLGILGLALGWRHLHTGGTARRTARWGMALSLVALLASTVMGLAYYRGIQVAHGIAAERLSELAAWQGVRAPDLEVMTLDGRTIRLSELRGRPVVLEFWDTRFALCARQAARLTQLRREVPAGQLAILGISSEARDPLQAFVTRQGVNYPVGWTTNAPPPFGPVRSIPTTFFLDRRGVIHHIALGYLPVADVLQLARRRSKTTTDTGCQDFATLQRLALAPDAAE